VGADLTETEWRGVARQLLAQGLLGVEGDFGVLTLTAASTGVLRQEREIMLAARAGTRPAVPEQPGRPGRRGGRERGQRGSSRPDAGGGEGVRAAA